MYFKEKIEEDKIDLDFCGTQDMIVDDLTKRFICEKHNRSSERMEIIKLN